MCSMPEPSPSARSALFWMGSRRPSTSSRVIRCWPARGPWNWPASTGRAGFGQAAEVVCDDAGRPTGLLLEDAACALVEAVAPRPGRDERRARAAAALASMAAAGLTGGHAMDGDGLDVYAALEAEGELPLRIRVAPWCQPDAADADAVAGLVRAQGTGGRLWRIAGVKLFLDGTIDNGTAWLERPDSHGESD